MDEWRRQIHIATLVKQRLAEVDSANRWPFHLPEPAASEEEIESVEKMLGYRLHLMYRDFLSYANGWIGFFQKIDLFGTPDLIAGPKNQYANDLLASIENIEALTGYKPHDIMPIAVSQEDIDLFVLTNPSSNQPGIVLWLAGGLIDSFSDFDEYFLAMVDYNRREIQRFEGKL